MIVWSPRVWAFVLLAMLLPAGCAVIAGLRGPVDTPARAFERLNRALQARDWAAVYDAAVSPATRATFDADLQKVQASLVRSGGAAMFATSVLDISEGEYLAMDARALYVRMSELAGSSGDLLVLIPDREGMREAKIVDTTIEGDEATLFVELPGGSRPVSMIREDGRWFFQVLDAD